MIPSVAVPIFPTCSEESGGCNGSSLSPWDAVVLTFQQLWWSLNVCIKFLRGFSLVSGPTGAGWAHAGISFLWGKVWVIAWGLKPSVYLGVGGKVFVKQIFVWSASVTAVMGKVPAVLKTVAHVNIVLKLSVSMEESYLLQHPPGVSLGWWGDALETGVMALPWPWVAPSLMSLGDLLNQQWVSGFLHGQGGWDVQGCNCLRFLFWFSIWALILL